MRRRLRWTAPVMLAALGMAACGRDAHDGASALESPIRSESVATDEVDESEPATDVAAASSPKASVEAYLDAMAAHDASAALDLYTDESRAAFDGRTMSDGQMDNLSRAYRGCPPAEATEQGDRAVATHPGESGRCSPWFLERGDDGLWRLDFATMSRAIRFDDRNQWRVADRDALGPYAFAFEE